MSLTDYQRQSFFGGSQVLTDEFPYYDANGNLINQGYAVAGTPKTAPKWLVQIHSYDSQNRWNGTITLLGQIWANGPF